jgi:hypothetical protein
MSKTRYHINQVYANSFFILQHNPSLIWKKVINDAIKLHEEVIRYEKQARQAKSAVPNKVKLKIKPTISEDVQKLVNIESKN